MSGRIEIVMPDGTVIDAPAGVTRAQIEAKLQGQSDANGLWNGIKNIGTAAYKGVADLAAGAADAFTGQNDPLDLAAAGFDKSKMAKPVPLGAVSTALEHTGYQPQTSGEKIINTTVRGATGALATPGGVIAPGKAAIAGGAAGFGSEGSARLFGDNLLNRILGGLAGGMVGGLASSAKTTRNDMAQEALRDVRESDLDLAKQRMIEAQQAGIPVNLSQAMPRDSNIDSLVAALANNRYGTKTTEMLRAQPGQVAFGMEDQLSKLPGSVRMPQVVANNAQEAASNAIKQRMKDATTAWEKYAPLDAQIPSSAMARLDKDLEALGKRHLQDTTARQLFDEVRGVLKQKEAQNLPGGALVDANGVPFNAPGQAPRYQSDALAVKEAIDDVLQNFGPRKLNTPGLDAKLQRRAQEIRELWRDVIDKNAPDLSKANAAYSSVIENSVEPAKKSVIGRVAGIAGALDDKEAVRGKVFQVLDAGTVPGGKSSEILTLEKAMRQVKPKPDGSGVDGAAAYQDAVKTWMASKVSKATQVNGGRMNDDVGLNLEQTFLKDDVASQGFKDAMVGLARSQGLADNALLPGMQNFMKIVSMTARRPASVRGISPQGFDEVATNSLAKNIGQVSVITPLRQPALRWLEFLKADAYKAMDQLLTSPEGVDMLKKLGKQPVMSKAAQDTISTFMATATALPPDPNSPGVTTP